MEVHKGSSRDWEEVEVAQIKDSTLGMGMVG